MDASSGACRPQGPHFWDECPYPPKGACTAPPNGDFDGYVNLFEKGAQQIKANPLVGRACRGIRKGTESIRMAARWPSMQRRHGWACDPVCSCAWTVSGWTPTALETAESGGKQPWLSPPCRVPPPAQAICGEASSNTFTGVYTFVRCVGMSGPGIGPACSHLRNAFALLHASAASPP